MNERILELAEQTSLELFNDTAHHRLLKGFAEKFAELIVQRCVELSDIAEKNCLHPGTIIKRHFGVEE
jgi:hypothetical protein